MTVQSTSNMTNILPKPLITHTLSYLGLHDLHTTHQVSQSMRDVCNQEVVWKHMVVSLGTPITRMEKETIKEAVQRTKNELIVINTVFTKSIKYIRGLSQSHPQFFSIFQAMPEAPISTCPFDLHKKITQWCKTYSWKQVEQMQFPAPHGVVIPDDILNRASPVLTLIEMFEMDELSVFAALQINTEELLDPRLKAIFHRAGMITINDLANEEVEGAEITPV